MKEEAQIKALAELSGKNFHKPTPEEIKSGSYYQYEPPNYLTDLNAIHELALKLRNKQYTVELRKIVMRDRKDFMEDEDSGITMDLYFYEATAPQRCEAILRATGRWVE